MDDVLILVLNRSIPWLFFSYSFSAFTLFTPCSNGDTPWTCPKEGFYISIASSGRGLAFYILRSQFPGLLPVYCLYNGRRLQII